MKTRLLERPGRSSGFSLLEVLVAIILLSLGFLSMLALQSRTLQYSTMAYYRGIATQIASGLADSIRANPDGDYTSTNMTGGSAMCSGITDPNEYLACRAESVRLDDIAWANVSLRRQLPNATVSVTQDSDADGRFADITLTWEDPSTENPIINPDCGDSTGKTQCVKMRVRRI